MKKGENFATIGKAQKSSKSAIPLRIGLDDWNCSVYCGNGVGEFLFKNYNY